MSEPTTPAINVLIWLAVKPIIKLALPSAAGYFLSRSGLFPVAGSRAASQIILNVTLPALMFAKIVPSFTSENVKAIGPIFLVGLVYMGLSFLMGFIILQLCPSPKNFRYGILAAAAWSNWGDLPTSVVQTVCLSAPFAGQADADLAIAYNVTAAAIFILIFYITLFPMRGTWFIQADYTRVKPSSDDEEEGVGANTGGWAGTREKVSRLLNRRRKAQPTRPEAETDLSSGEENVPATERTVDPTRQMATFSDLRRQTSSRSIGSHSIRELASTAQAAAVDDTSEHNRKWSFGRAQLQAAQNERERLKTIMASPAQSVSGDETVEVSEFEGQARRVNGDGGASFEKAGPSSEQGTSSSIRQGGKWTHFAKELRSFVTSCITPPTISLVFALVCALVKPVKALFLDASYSFHPTAPDGLPPLAIVLDTAAFLGNASVPLGLIVLGSALQRMRLPRPISRLPFASITALAVAKLVILPVFGFFFVQALVRHTNLVREDQVVLRFVLTYFSVVPAATTQHLTSMRTKQIFAPEDGESNSDVLASYLIVQYLIFVFSSVILTAFTLNEIF
ncbi:BZ3500_MvSof-1268-A1-R1_Chr1-1g01084 [Microbotryum saponariae]|uniref:BZ3500_MvSof-1268-A1-R1_Chr1-1g01084 protein n=1 Tax=Microbotryum saponariae TaxID=289078 RepID=A0A2X0KIX3_9BASI|nr:BZ3500_MvSof-1268-A1-R1_Chr1-1g01084 [Microbotryum saponariae]SCZ93369.1 BZ3501_MvSof-1269-A2-R1_Chr1-1g00681 [Microbotryum saponariae]